MRSIASPPEPGEAALRYLSRYVFKTATGDRDLPLLPDGRVRWRYRDSTSGVKSTWTWNPSS